MKSLKRHFYFNKLDSTSAYIKRRRLSLRNFSFVSCGYQTQGKGRENRVWISNPNENLMFSLFITDGKIVEKYSYLSLLSAVCVSLSLKKLGIQSLIKWPNDVYVNGEKICGILLEGISDNDKINSVIIGVGINLNQTEFIKDLIHSPTSVRLQLDKKVDIKKIRKLVYKTFIKQLKLLKQGNLDFIEYAKNNDFLKDKEVFAEIDNNKQKIKVLGINDDCSLKILKQGKEIDLISGEISFHV